MKSLIIVSLLTLFFLSFIPASALADDRAEVKAFLQERLTSVTAILRDKKMTEENKKEKILDVVNPAFDFAKIGKNTLGRKHWPKLSRKQKIEFVDRFTQLLQRISLSALLSYSSENITIEEPVKVKNKIHVPTFVMGDKKITIVYKFYQSRSGWLVYDIEVDGVSVTRTYRTQFNEFLQKQTIDELVMELDKDPREDKS